MTKKMTAVLLLICLALLPVCSLADGTLNVMNYGEYIDEKVIYDFEKEFGVRINYTFNDTPESMYTKLQTGVSYDVVVTSDYMIDRLIKENNVQKMDKSVVTNLDQLSDSVKNLYFDPDNDYSAPYLWQNVVLCYDTTKIDPTKVEEKGWSILLDPELEGHVFLYDSPRDIFMIGLKALGYSMNTESRDELMEAYESRMERLRTIFADPDSLEEAQTLAEELWDEMIQSWDNILRLEGRQLRTVQINDITIKEKYDIQAVIPFILKDWVVDVEAL